MQSVYVYSLLIYLHIYVYQHLSSHWWVKASTSLLQQLLSWATPLTFTVPQHFDISTTRSCNFWGLWHDSCHVRTQLSGWTDLLGWRRMNNTQMISGGIHRVSELVYCRSLPAWVSCHTSISLVLTALVALSCYTYIQVFQKDNFTQIVSCEMHFVKNGGVYLLMPSYEKQYSVSDWKVYVRPL